jgi:hypothetical protein
VPRVARQEPFERLDRARIEVAQAGQELGGGTGHRPRVRHRQKEGDEALVESRERHLEGRRVSDLGPEALGLEHIG